MIIKTRYYWKIEMLAKNLLEQCSCFSKPCDGIDLMIESCNIDIILIDVDEELCGLFGHDENGYKFIAYNKNMIPERILFTKAHELGHFVLKHELIGEFLTDKNFKNIQKDPQETEANVFASRLLMPTKRVKEVITDTFGKLDAFDYKKLNYTENQKIINAMKVSFKTSKQAIEFRLLDVSEN